MVEFLRDVYDATIFGKAAAARDERELRRKETKAKADADRKVKILEAQRKIRPLIDDIYVNLGDNPSEAGKAIEDVFAAYQFETGEQVDPAVVKALKDPKFGKGLLDASLETGATLGDIFTGGKQPLLRAEARVAIGKRANQLRVQEAVGGPQESPAPAAQGPEQLAGPGMDEAPGPSASPAPQAGGGAAAPGVNPALAPHVAAIDAQITQLQARKQAAVRANANPAATAALDQQLQALEKRRAEMTEGVDTAGVLADVKRRAEPTPTDMLREGAPATRGGLEDAREAGSFQPLTPAGLEAQKTAAQQAETAAGGQMKQIREIAEAARKNIPIYQRVSALVETAGKTGRLVGPLRKAIGDGLSLVLPASTVNRLTKLSDVELLSQANIELALAGLKDVGGNDTERELLTLIQSKPGLLNTKQTNQFATRWALAGYEQNLYRSQLADQWITSRQSEGKPASLRSVDSGGMTFNQRWDRYLANHPLYARVARDLGLDPVQFAASLGFDEGKATRAFGGR